MQRLQDSRRVTLNGSGSGTVTFGPSRPGEKWTITRVGVQATTNTLESVAQVYRGTPGPASRISGTFAGSSGDTDPDLNEDLWSGEYLSVQWTAGDPAAVATATFWGVIN